MAWQGTLPAVEHEEALKLISETIRLEGLKVGSGDAGRSIAWREHK